MQTTKRCATCRSAMSYGPADIEQTVHGVRVRMLSVPLWQCPSCGEQQVSMPVGRYISEFVRRLVADLPSVPEDLAGPLAATEVVFSAK